MTKFLLTSAASIMTILVVPLIALLFYLKRYLKEKNGNASQFRKTMFYVLSAKALFLLSEIAVMILVAFTAFDGLGTVVLLAVNISALIFCIANWFALFKIRRILKRERAI